MTKLFNTSETRKALDPIQMGFKKNQSTQTALLELTDDIHMGRENNFLPSSYSLTLAKHLIPSRPLNYYRNWRIWDSLDQHSCGYIRMLLIDPSLLYPNLIHRSQVKQTWEFPSGVCPRSPAVLLLHQWSQTSLESEEGTLANFE